jgi:alpha-beta hydrolase superfamily lysophospholipase
MILESTHDKGDLWDSLRGPYPGQKDGVNTYFRLFKPKKETPETIYFLFLHDIGSYHEYCLGLGEYLQKIFGPRVGVCYTDLRGHGLSNGSRAHLDSFDVYVDDLKVILYGKDSPLLGKKVVIIGQGLGGLLSLRHLARREGQFPTEILGQVLLNPLIFTQFYRPPQWFMKLGPNPIAKKALGGLSFPFEFKGTELIGSIKQAEKFDSDPLISHYASVSLILEVLKVSKEMKKLGYFIDIPSYFLFGEKSSLIQVRKAYQFAKGVGVSKLGVEILPGMKQDIIQDENSQIAFVKIQNWLEKQFFGGLDK